MRASSQAASTRADKQSSQAETCQHDHRHIHDRHETDAAIFHDVGPNRENQAPEASAGPARHGAVAPTGVVTLRTRPFASPASSRYERHRDNEKSFHLVGGTEGSAN